MTEFNENGNSRDNSSRPGWKKGSDEGAERPASRSSDRPRRDSNDAPRRDDRGEGRRDDRPRREDRGNDRTRRDNNDRPRREGDARGPRGANDSRGPRRDDRGPRQERPGRAGDGRDNSARPDWQTRVERPRDPERAKSPMIPEEITEKDLDLLARVQLKTLSPENAERVSRHLAMVNLLINEDPELAHKHAIAAADRAGRIGMVRETLGLTAYTVGDFALALRELQAYRRISGSDDQLPVMVDCERGLGRPDRALELGRSVDKSKLDAGVRVNLAIAMSGARLDKAQFDLALAELEIPELNPSRVLDYSPHLFRAYAHTLELLGRVDDMKKWHDLADRADVALAEKAAPDVETLKVIEEIVIPEPYESKSEGRYDWAPRGESRGGRGDTRGDSRGDSRGGRGDSRGGRSFDRDADRPARGGARDGGFRNGGARTSRDGGARDGGARDGGDRDGGSRGGDRGGWKKPQRD